MPSPTTWRRSGLKSQASTAPLPRGNLLIFGGDGAYPTAARDVYLEAAAEALRMRLLQEMPATTAPPYPAITTGTTAWPHSPRSCSWLVQDFANGAWRTPQSRSYFAARLPHDWWLLGVDVQLTHDIDEPQVKYFEDVIKHRMQKGDRVIFCCAEPFWVY